MTRRPRNLETRYRWLPMAIVGVFSLAFAVGLALYAVEPGSRGAAVALNGGLVLLMLSPAIRILLATAERARRRDGAFILMTVAVLVELGIVLWRAS